jgi:hypothetical protein
MIKKIFVSLCMLATAVVFSQENSASPYSYYGIGDQKFKGTVENRAMGGLGVQADSIHLNLQNPASYNALRMTTFTIGAGNTGTTFKTSSQESKANRTSLDYLAVALPFKKIGFAFGLMPYTAVGYRIQNTAVDPADGITRDRRFTGKGGLNRAFIGASYNIFKGFSLGADFQYNFGNIETKSIVGIEDVQYPTRELNETDYSGYSFNIGAMYQSKINEKLSIHASATYTPESTLNAITNRRFSAITDVNFEGIVEDISFDEINEDVKIASKYSFGAGIGENRKWFAGAEYSAQGANKLANRFDDVTSAGFESSYRISVGGYYVPNYMSYNSYLNRITYRAGVRYENTGLVVNGEEIKDLGLSLGVGLPLGGSYVGSSNLNLGFEMGKRGTTSAGLVQENYVGLFVSLSFNDRWFVKRRYN